MFPAEAVYRQPTLARTVFIPPLTTVRQESKEPGCRAVPALSRLIALWHDGVRIATMKPVWLQSQLIVEASSIRQQSSEPEATEQSAGRLYAISASSACRIIT